MDRSSFQSPFPGVSLSGVAASPSCSRSGGASWQTNREHVTATRSRRMHQGPGVVTNPTAVVIWAVRVVTPRTSPNCDAPQTGDPARVQAAVLPNRRSGPSHVALQGRETHTRGYRSSRPLPEEAGNEISSYRLLRETASIRNRRTSQ